MRKAARHYFLAGLAFIVLSFSLVSSVFAIMTGLSIDELVKASEHVITGQVIDVSSMWSDDGKTIVTRSTVQVTEVVRGRLTEKTIVIEQRGGIVGDIGFKVSDIEPLTKDEQVILFLGPANNRKAGKVHEIVGRAQGKYTVDKNGTASKKGYSLAAGQKDMDNNIPVATLKDKIREVK